MTTVDIETHDVIAIGCGPFNLGLAALASTRPEVDLLVLDAAAELRWHPGVMFDDAQLQLSFLADLVTVIDPTNPLSFLSYLRDQDRMYAFYIREVFHPTRREYEDYLRWAAARLSSIRWSHSVDAVQWDAAQQRFVLDVTRAGGQRVRFAARDLVIGIGTEPWMPSALAGLPPGRVLHSGSYLHRARDIASASSVTVVGSGQSGAECMMDLLRRSLDGGPAASWLTRTATFAPLDYTKLTLEQTTPEYVRYFHALPQDVKDRRVAEQWQHYKGISNYTLEQIHDLLYQREFRAALAPIELRAGVAVEAATTDERGDVVLTCRHRDTGAAFEHRTALVVAATGYKERQPRFLEPMFPMIRRDERARYKVRLDYSIELNEAIAGRIFVVNAELHTHGVATPDLGISAFRNATILNAITGRELYRLPTRTAYASFGIPTPGQPVRQAPRVVER